MKYLEKLAERYYDAWTSDGIDAFHADVQEITAWLKRKDLYTATDEDLAALTDDEIEKIAAIISEMVRKENTAYYILRDLDGYGSEYPICVDRAEAERLMREWYNPDDAPDFDEIWKEASEEDIAKYGRYDSDWN